MTRQAFLDRLRANLRGLQPQATNDIIADYDAHFAEGLVAGRTEAQISDALGSPDRLARELRAEATMKRWEEDKNPAAAVGAIVALLGLGAIDIFILLPILIVVMSVLCALYAGAAAVLIAGVFVTIFGPFTTWPDSFGTFLLGLAMVLGALSALAALTLVSVGLVNILVRYGRLHFKLLNPTLSSKDARA